MVEENGRFTAILEKREQMALLRLSQAFESCTRAVDLRRGKGGITSLRR